MPVTDVTVNAPGAAGPAPMDVNDLAAKVARLIQRNKGDATEAMQVLMDDNKALRDARRTLTEQLDKASKIVIPDGGAVLTKEEAATWTAFKALNIKPDEVTTLKSANAAFLADKTTNDRRGITRDAANVGQYNPDTLFDLLQMKSMMVESREITVRDPNDTSKSTKEKSYFVRPIGDDKAVATELTEWVDRDLKGWKAALQRTDASDTPNAPDPLHTERPASYPVHASLPRPGTVPSNGKDFAEAHVKSSYLTPSQLRNPPK